MIERKGEQVTLCLLTVIFTIVSLQGFFLPVPLLEPVEIVLETASGLAEVRAAYGGAFAALAFLMFLGARNEAHALLALQVVTIVLGGCTLGRALSFVLDGKPNSFSILMHGVEAFGFLVGAFLVIARSKSSAQGELTS